MISSPFVPKQLLPVALRIGLEKPLTAQMGVCLLRSW